MRGRRQSRRGAGCVYGEETTKGTKNPRCDKRNQPGGTKKKRRIQRRAGKEGGLSGVAGRGGRAGRGRALDREAGGLPALTRRLTHGPRGRVQQLLTCTAAPSPRRRPAQRERSET